MASEKRLEARIDYTKEHPLRGPNRRSAYVQAPASKFPAAVERKQKQLEAQGAYNVEILYESTREVFS
jgi:hypothetical protein